MSTGVTEDETQENRPWREIKSGKTEQNNNIQWWTTAVLTLKTKRIITDRWVHRPLSHQHK